MYRMEISTPTPSEVIEIRDEPMSELEDGELETDDEEPCIKYPQKSHPPIHFDEPKDKLLMRAKRFGLLGTRRPVYDPSIQKVHDSMGVTNKTRTEALHLFGTEGMQTHDVFGYFEDCTPASVEWLSDKSCNVVWLDPESCVKALKKYSVKIKGQVDEDMESDEEGSINVADLRCSLPPGGIWRKGVSKGNGQTLLMRYATFSDKREFKPIAPIELVMKSQQFPDRGDENIKKTREDNNGTNPWSSIARQWGHFDKTSGRDGRPVAMDAREVLKQRELRESLIQRDARELLSFNKICRLEQELIDGRPSMHRRRDFLRPEVDSSRRGRDFLSKRRRESDSENESDRSLLLKRRRSPQKIEENLKIIVENDIYKESRTKRKKRPVPIKTEKGVSGEETHIIESSSSSSDSSQSSSSSSSDSDSTSESSSSSEEEDEDSELMKRTSGDLRFRWKQSSTPFKPTSPLRIEIDNDMYRGLPRGQSRRQNTSSRRNKKHIRSHSNRSPSSSDSSMRHSRSSYDDDSD